MGLYDRDYYREFNTGVDGLTPVVKGLLVANIAVFLLQIFVTQDVRPSRLESLRKINPKLDKLIAEKEAEGPEALDKLKKDYPGLDKLLTEDEKSLDNLFLPTIKRSVVEEWCNLDTKKVVHEGQVWRLLTHAFCHDRFGIFHILLNMICLYWFGGTLETMYGSREFLLFYLTAAVVAGLAFVGLDLYTGSSIPGIGASGAVMAVMMLYTMHFPYETICIFWFFPVQMRWVMAFYLIFDLHPVLLALSGDQFFTGIAHAAHLGGLVFGFLYSKFDWRLEPLVDRVTSLHWRTRSRPRLRLLKFPDRETEPSQNESRVDELLQKIHEQGETSLSPDERELLRDESERIRNRQNGNG